MCASDLPLANALLSGVRLSSAHLFGAANPLEAFGHDSSCTASRHMLSHDLECSLFYNYGSQLAFLLLTLAVGTCVSGIRLILSRLDICTKKQANSARKPRRLLANALYNLGFFLLHTLDLRYFAAKLEGCVAEVLLFATVALFHANGSAPMVASTAAASACLAYYLGYCYVLANRARRVKQLIDNRSPREARKHFAKMNALLYPVRFTAKQFLASLALVALSGLKLAAPLSLFAVEATFYCHSLAGAPVKESAADNALEHAHSVAVMLFAALSVASFAGSAELDFTCAVLLALYFAAGILLVLFHVCRESYRVLASVCHIEPEEAEVPTESAPNDEEREESDSEGRKQEKRRADSIHLPQPTEDEQQLNM
jgi:hypothetical protein